MEPVQWENAVTSIGKTENFTQVLNRAGDEGWEPWTVINVTEEGIQVALKRHKRKVLLSTDIQGALTS